MSDRLAGLVLMIVSGGYLWLAGSYQAGFGDPLGPAAFPRVIGVPALLLSVLLVAFPAHRAEWAGSQGLLRQGAALAVLLGYALLLEPLGFVPATALAYALLARLLGATALQAVVTALLVAPGLYLLFDRVMGLPLPFLGEWIG